MKLHVSVFKFLFAAFVITVAIDSAGQFEVSDSLQAILAGKHGVERARILIEIARSFGDVNNQFAYEYAKLAHSSAIKIGDTSLIVKAGRIQSQMLRRIGKIDSAILLFNRMLPIAKRLGDSREIKTILNSLGVAYLNLGKYDKALVFFFELLRQCEDEQDMYWKTIVLNNLGLVYQNLEDYETAMKYRFESLSFQSSHDHELTKTLSYLNIAECLAYKSEFVECRVFVKKASESCGGDCSTSIQQALYNVLGIAAFRENNFGEAESHFIKSFRLNDELNYGDMGLESLAYLVRINTRNGRLDVAEEYLRPINEMISQGVTHNRQVLLAYQSVIAMYENLGDFKKLAHYQKKYIDIRDGAFAQSLTTNLMKIEAAHLEEENKAKIDSQNKILALNKLVILRQKYINVFACVIALLLVILALMLRKSIKRKEKLNAILDMKVKERTVELQVNHDVLKSACDEREVLLDKVTSEVKSCIATIKGLCSVARKDASGALLCLDEVDAVSDKLFGRVRTLTSGVKDESFSLKN